MKKTLLHAENWHPKALTLLVLLFVLTLSGYTQGVAINSTAAPANSSAGLDISFSNKGFLVSRVALSSTTTASPLTAHVAGMIVYNTATTGDVIPGLYYNDGTKWVAFVVQPGTTSGDMQYWDGTKWVILPIGQEGQRLKLNESTGLPEWSN